MARYVTIKGWICCSFEEIETIKTAIYAVWFGHDGLLTTEQLTLYWGGWYFPEQPINWESVITYGACINVACLSVFNEVIANMAALDLDISAYFEADIKDIDTVRQVWRI